MNFSLFGKKMTCDAGILSLMDDLGKAIGSGKKMIMMGGGNPGRIPAFQELIRECLLDICRDQGAFQQLIGNYSPPQGDTNFLEAIAELLREENGWNVTADNICLTNGSQTAFFMLFNLFGGQFDQSGSKKICLPMAPEYIGYADLGLKEDLFVANEPQINLVGEDFFKYRIDFNRLDLSSDIGAICVSRPTNPTGNVITDSELSQLMSLAEEFDIPLIIDSAYGVPFPAMIYQDATPKWNEQMVVCLSLSKLGLPAVRTGIVVAHKKVVKALSSMNAIMSLSPNSFGALIVHELVSSKKIIDISRSHIQPFYKEKMEKAISVIRQEFQGIPYRIHVPEGAMFLWFWFQEIPISSFELYKRLKANNVLVVSGHYFFTGLPGDWSHRNECIRVTYAQDEDEVPPSIIGQYCI